MRLRHTALALLLCLAGCSSSGPDAVVSAITEGFTNGGAEREADDLASNITRAEIDRLLPAGFAHGDRYSDEQASTVERYC